MARNRKQNNFEEIPWGEKEFEESMTPYINQIYYTIFDKENYSISEIIRNNRNNSSKAALFMDRNLAIDTHIKFKYGSSISLQEKTLHSSKRKYNEFTFEYYNDPPTKEKGEWFKLESQLYFFGYANEEENEYTDFWIIHVPNLRLYLQRYILEIGLSDFKHKFLRKNPPPARANFFAIPFILIEELADTLISYKWNKNEGIITNNLKKDIDFQKINELYEQHQNYLRTLKNKLGG